MSIGENIHHLRLKKGLTQNKLAELLFVSPQAVSKWETGKSTPNTEMLPAIAQALSVSISKLFD